MERSASMSPEGVILEANVTASVMLRHRSVLRQMLIALLPVPDRQKSWDGSQGSHPFPFQRLSAYPLPVWLLLGECCGLGCLSLQGDG